jgi:protein TonB
MSDRRPTGRPGPSWRIFLAFLLMSAAAHAAVLIALGPRTSGTPPLRPAALEVVIQAPRSIVLETGKRASDAREANPARSVPARAALVESPRMLPRDSGFDLREPDAGASTAEPAASALASSAAAESPRREPHPATAVATAPSVSAAYLSTPAPRYPDAARSTGDQGTVTLRVRVARDGTASGVSVEKSSGSPHLDAAALEAVRAWRFVPARRGGDAVESWMLVPILFRLESPS